MNFEKWLKENEGRTYSDIVKDLVNVDDPKFFDIWAEKNRLKEFSGGDWAMFAIYCLDYRIKELEKKTK